MKYNTRNNKELLTQRQINSLETKKTLWNSAIYLFETYGYDNVTVDEISARAGVSKGSFYTHFPSKESILIEEFAKIDSYYDVELDKLNENASSSEKIRTMYLAMCYYCENICGLDFIRVVYINQISNKRCTSIINNKDRNLYRKYTQLIQEGKNNKEYSVNLDIEYTVELIVRSARSLLYDWCLYDGNFSLYEEGKKTIEMVLDILKGKVVNIPTPNK